MKVGPDCEEKLFIGQRICCENHFYCGKCYQCLHGRDEQGYFLSHLTHQNTQKWCKGGVISIIGETVELNQWIHRFY